MYTKKGTDMTMVDNFRKKDSNVVKTAKKIITGTIR